MKKLPPAESGPNRRCERTSSAKKKLSVTLGPRGARTPPTFRERLDSGDRDNPLCDRIEFLLADFYKFRQSASMLTLRTSDPQRHFEKNAPVQILAGSFQFHP